MNRFFLVVFIALFQFHWAQNIDSLEAAISIAKSDTNKTKLYLTLSTAWAKNKRDLDKTVEYAMLAREHARTIKYMQGEIKGLNMIAFGFLYKNAPSTAIKYVDSALRYAGESGDKRILAKLWANRGLSYDSLNLCKEAIKSYDKAVKLCKEVKNYQLLQDLYYALSRSYFVCNRVNEKNGVPENQKLKEVMYYADLSVDVVQKHHVKGEFLRFQLLQ